MNKLTGLIFTALLLTFFISEVHIVNASIIKGPQPLTSPINCPISGPILNTTSNIVTSNNKATTITQSNTIYGMQFH